VTNNPQTVRALREADRDRRNGGAFMRGWAASIRSTCQTKRRKMEWDTRWAVALLRTSRLDATPLFSRVFAFFRKRGYRPGGSHSTFRQLHDRVAGSSRALSRHGSNAGRRPAGASCSRHETGVARVDLCLAWLGVSGVGETPGCQWLKSIKYLADASPQWPSSGNFVR